MDEYRPTVRDRVVQNALRHVLEPILERQFAEHSYGFRPNRGCKDAVRRVDRLIKALRKHVADNSVIGLVEKFLQAQVLDGMDHWTPVAGASGSDYQPLVEQSESERAGPSDGGRRLRDDSLRG